MKNIRSALSTIVVLVLSIIQVAEAKPKEKFALVIHGGVICIDAKGNIAMPFNTKGMYRGYIKSDGKAVTLIYKKD